MRILVIGATGKTGSELVRLLAKDGHAVVAVTRNRAKALALFPNNAETIDFDFESPRTFAPALKNAEKVFLIARPGDNDSDRVAIPFIDEVVKSNVRHIVNLTAMGVEQDDDFMLRRLEKYVEASGIPFTHLRPNWFMQNFNSGPMYADIRRTGALHLPAAEAGISFIDVRDIAAVAFMALTQPGHDGAAHTLTGGAALDHFQVTAALSRVAGRTITYVPLTEEMAVAGLTKAGTPADLIGRWTDFYRKIRLGLCEPVSDAVERILGRAPITFEQYTEDHAVAWR